MKKNLRWLQRYFTLHFGLSSVLPPRLLPWPFNSFGKFIWKRTLDTPGKSIVRLLAAFLAASSHPTSSTRRVSKHLHRDIRGSPPCYGVYLSDSCVHANRQLTAVKSDYKRIPWNRYELDFRANQLRTCRVSSIPDDNNRFNSTCIIQYIFHSIHVG